MRLSTEEKHSCSLKTRGHYSICSEQAILAANSAVRDLHHRFQESSDLLEGYQNSQRPLYTTHSPSTPFVTACAMTAVHSLPVRW